GGTYPPGPWSSGPVYEDGSVASGRVPPTSTTLNTNAGLDAGQPSQHGAIKVAILLPLSGQNAAMGQSMLQAAQLAVFDVGNDNFELISKDTGGTPQGASAAATAAMNEGAQLILGPL